MSAVPKKKLCWNCEGNITKEIENCPYCGVYVHSQGLDGIYHWSAPYSKGYDEAEEEEEVPLPLYSIQANKEPQELKEAGASQAASGDDRSISDQLKRDLFPILLLMAGSIFFLFGLVLFLFSKDGALTLQWSSALAPYFLALSLPGVFFGWTLLQKLD